MLKLTTLHRKSETSCNSEICGTITINLDFTSASIRAMSSRKLPATTASSIATTPTAGKASEDAFIVAAGGGLQVLNCWFVTLRLGEASQAVTRASPLVRMQSFSLNSNSTIL